MTTYVSWLWDIGPYRFGYSHDLVHDDRGSPYLERWILWFGFTLRVHKFWRPDDDRAPHDHPWWFITFPLTDYYETVYESSGRPEWQRVAPQLVSAFRFHYRPAKYRHIVCGAIDDQPFYTLVMSGPKSNQWGFWPDGATFIYWRDWFGS